MRAARRCHAQGALASAAGIKWSGRIRRHEDREPLPGVAIRDLDEEGKTRLARTRSRARPFGGRGTAHHPRAVGKRGLGIRRNSPVSVSRPLAASNPGFRRAVRCADFRISPEPDGIGRRRPLRIRRRWAGKAPARSSRPPRCRACREPSGSCAAETATWRPMTAFVPGNAARRVIPGGGKSGESRPRPVIPGCLAGQGA